MASESKPTRKAKSKTSASKSSSPPARKGRSKAAGADNKTYERIKVAALSLFADKGVEPTSIRDIGTKADVPTSLLYHYAPSKHLLVYEIMRDGMERYQASAFDARGLGRNYHEQLAGLVSAHMIMHCRNRQLAKVIDNGWRPLPRAEKTLMLETRDNYSRLWDEVLREGVKDDAFTLEDPHMARLAIVQMCSVSNWFSPTGPLTTKELVQHFGELVFRAVGANDKGKPVSFASVERPSFEDAMAIVELHHQGAVFGRKK